MGAKSWLVRDPATGAIGVRFYYPGIGFRVQEVSTLLEAANLQEQWGLACSNWDLVKRGIEPFVEKILSQ
jgi:hypothetical protein